MDFPEITITCDETQQLGDQWYGCADHATSMLVYHHVGPKCDTITMALCPRHAAAATKLVEALKSRFETTGTPKACKYCRTPVGPDDIGNIQEI